MHSNTCNQQGYIHQNSEFLILEMIAIKSIGVTYTCIMILFIKYWYL